MKPDPNEMSPKNNDNEQADDVATLYSWANLHGAKYRDFSAARQEMRAEMRQSAIAERARMAREEAQKQHGLEGKPLWEDLLPEGRRPTGTLSGRTDPLPRGGMEQKRPENNGLPRALERPERPQWAEDWAASGMPASVGESPSPRSFPPREEPAAESVRTGNGRLSDADLGPPVRPAWLEEPQSYPQGAGNELLQQSRERVASRWFALR